MSKVTSDILYAETASVDLYLGFNFIFLFLVEKLISVETSNFHLNIFIHIDS